MMTPKEIEDMVDANYREMMKKAPVKTAPPNLWIDESAEIEAFKRQFKQQAIVEKTRTTEREVWLKETQDMRVVALNEAISFYKAHIEAQHGNAIITPRDVNETAHMFAKFLIDGETR